MLAAVGQHQEALATYDRVLALKPDSFMALYNRGAILAQLSRFEEAVDNYSQALRLQQNAVCFNSRAIALAELGQLAAALDSCERAIVLQPNFGAALDTRGNVLRRLDRPLDAVASYQQALRALPRDFRIWYNRGVVLSELGRNHDALDSFDQAIAINNSHADAWAGRGAAQLKLERFADALASLDKALLLTPHNAEALHNRGVALWHLKRPEDALISYGDSLRYRPANTATSLNRGLLLQEMHRHQDALADFDRVVERDSDNALAWNARGTALQPLKRDRDALASFDRAVVLNPNLAEALSNRGLLRWSLEHNFAAARADQENALALDPHHPFLPGELLHIKMHAGDWADFDQDRAALDAAVLKGERVVRPFAYQAMAESPLNLQACARIFEQSLNLTRRELPPMRAAREGKIRVAYLSGEFREQATAYLMVGLYELHDRERFEIVAVDSGGGDASPMRKRLEAAFDRFLYIANLPDDRAAKLIRDEQIDILVNLNGYFGSARMGVFAQRAAPLQINYLGFPGTLGADYMDYIIADRIVIPEEHCGFYDEEVIYLPGCYQVNDAKRAISAQLPARADAGLPDKGFVFCNFNQSYKLTPRTFAGWMRILGQVQNSVLWLLHGAPPLAENLRKAAAGLGISPDRLIFAPSLPLAEHLARLKLADLFLDSLPYNAHTTASDALWAGVPLLTLEGSTFPGRVASSLLQAANLPELVTRSQEQYEILAVELANDPSVLQKLRRKVEEVRSTCSLFDTDLFRRNIEAAYIDIWERAQQGIPPRGSSRS